MDYFTKQKPWNWQPIDYFVRGSIDEKKNEMFSQ